MQLLPLVWKTKQLFVITEKIQKLLPRGNSAHHAFSVLTKESGGRPTSIPSRRTLQLLPMDFWPCLCSKIGTRRAGSHWKWQNCFAALLIDWPCLTATTAAVIEPFVLQRLMLVLSRYSIGIAAYTIIFKNNNNIYCRFSKPRPC